MRRGSHRRRAGEVVRVDEGERKEQTARVPGAAMVSEGEEHPGLEERMVAGDHQEVARQYLRSHRRMACR